MLLHLLQSKVADKDNESGDIIVNLDKVLYIQLVKYSDDEGSLYVIALDYGAENAKETHDTEESARASLKEILKRMNGNEALEIPYNIRHVIRKSDEQKMKKLLKKALDC
jgi:uncharacterized protein YpiB (UPF0302 family)